MTDSPGAPLPDHAGVSSAELSALLEDWIDTQRWFAGKGRERGPIRIESRSPLGQVRGDADIEIVVIAVDVAGDVLSGALQLGGTHGP